MSSLFQFRSTTSYSSARSLACQPKPMFIRCQGRALYRQLHSPLTGEALRGCQSLHIRCRSRIGTQISASWGGEISWGKGEIAETSTAALGLQKILIDAGPVAEGYKKAGQFVQVKIGESKPGFFAIASPPDPNNQGVLELLIKSQGGTSELLCGSSEGTEVDVSPVMGKGFPVEKSSPAEFPTVLLFATGSGISPIKALIESEAIQAKERKDVRLYYGTRSPEHMAFKDSIPAWEASGVKVIPVYSNDGKGFVQDIFLKNGKLEAGDKTTAFLCGQKEMCVAVTELLTDQGVAKEQILLNF